MKKTILATDPFYRLTRKVNGKTVTETFALPAALRKAQKEIAEYHRFRELSRDLLEINEKICRAQPVADTLTPEEKKRSSTPSSRPVCGACKRWWDRTPLSITVASADGIAGGPGGDRQVRRERVAESIGADIARPEQQQIDRAVQLDLPIVGVYARFSQFARTKSG